MLFILQDESSGTTMSSRTNIIFAKKEVQLTVYHEDAKKYGIPTGFQADIEGMDSNYRNTKNSD